MSEHYDFKWRYQPPLDSHKATLLKYVQNRELHPLQDKTAMIINALTAYYLPVALWNEGIEDSTRLELVTMDCLKALANQFNYLCAVLGIDPQKVGGLISGVVPTSAQTSSNFRNVDAEDEEIEDFDLQLWNLAGMTTDKETFD